MLKRWGHGWASSLSDSTALDLSEYPGLQSQTWILGTLWRRDVGCHSLASAVGGKRNMEEAPEMGF